MYAIEATNLKKKFREKGRDFWALKGIDMRIKAITATAYLISVFGFIENILFVFLIPFSGFLLKIKVDSGHSTIF